MQEGYHGTFTAAQVQAIIPVCAKSLTDAVTPHLFIGKVQYSLHMLIYRAAASVGIGDDFLQKIEFAGLLHIFRNRADQP